MSSERFEELKGTGRMPSPSGVGLRLLVLAQDEECSLEEVVRAIQADPALTGRIIRLASSVQMAGNVRIASAKEAAVRLGLRAVCNLALGFSLVSGNRTGRCKSFDYDRYWSFSLASAVAAQTISQTLGIAAPTEAFTCALLSRIGRLALASVHPTRYGEVLERVEREPGVALADAEREAFGIDHVEVTGAMLDDWGLPLSFAEAALYADGREPEVAFEQPQTADLVRLLVPAALMAEVCLSDPARQPHHWPDLRQLCSTLRIEVAELRRIFDRVVPVWQEWGELLTVPTAGVLPAEELETQWTSDDDLLVGSGKLRILAVDDDPVSLRLLVRLLQKHGHDVITARNGKEALAAYVNHNAQMVITDWMMPQMDGIQLCKSLRKSPDGRKLYVLILTGRAEEERIVEALHAGADDYIVKPFKPHLLEARLQPALRVIRLQQENERAVKAQEELNSQLEAEKRKFKAAAMTDPLTELPNRRFAMKRLEKEWANSARTGTPFAVIMLDLDEFKVFNDRYGHDVGDAVLKQTSRAITRVLRRGDVCARFGGEEFLVICPTTDSTEGALRLAERIREAVADVPIQLAEGTRHITASLGVALRTAQVTSIDALLKIADQAVYRAKAQQKNRVELGLPSEAPRKSA